MQIFVADPSNPTHALAGLQSAFNFSAYFFFFRRCKVAFVLPEKKFLPEVFVLAFLGDVKQFVPFHFLVLKEFLLVKVQQKDCKYHETVVQRIGSVIAEFAFISFFRKIKKEIRFSFIELDRKSTR